MPYDIEVLALGDDVYSDLGRAVTALNGVQDQFRFSLARGAPRDEGLAFEREAYLTTDVWTFLREQRKRVGGHRPYVIAFVAKPLSSARYSNLFGSHEGEEGLAVVTAASTAQYIKEVTRYYSYFMVRYALSFINPYIRAHNDGARKKCYFHFKSYKPDIRVSMDSGVICDECRKKLNNPPAIGVAHRLSIEESGALTRMLDYVSGELPHAIILKGGGVKGLAFAGALLEIEKYYWFDRHVGTSAGAIAATLLAASYTPAELTTLLLEKSFRDFMDAPWWRIPFNLLWWKGCFPGEACQLWIADLLAAKTKKIAEVPMSALDGAIIYAARQGSGTLTFDSRGERKHTGAAFAARCSMSIPFFFFPVTVDGRRVFDGGLRNNFPLTRFLSQEPRSNFIALYLGKPDNTNSRGLILGDILNIVVEGEERQTVDAHRDKVVVIDTSPIGTIDFDLSDVEKEFLLRVGKAAALEFLRARNFDDGPTQEDVVAAQNQAELCRQAVFQGRRWRRQMRLVLGSILSICIIVVSIVAYMLVY